MAAGRMYRRRRKPIIMEMLMSEKRQMAIYQEDRNKTIRKSHENPYIIKLYEEFLGRPMSEKAHKLLHTAYFDRT